jgi:hypothetical protein
MPGEEHTLESFLEEVVLQISLEGIQWKHGKNQCPGIKKCRLG